MYLSDAGFLRINVSVGVSVNVSVSVNVNVTVATSVSVAIVIAAPFLLVSFSIAAQTKIPGLMTSYIG